MSSSSLATSSKTYKPNPAPSISYFKHLVLIRVPNWASEFFKLLRYTTLKGYACSLRRINSSLFFLCSSGLVKAGTYCVYIQMRSLIPLLSHARTIAPNGFKIRIRAYIYAPFLSPTMHAQSLQVETLPEGDVESIYEISSASCHV